MKIYRTIYRPVVNTFGALMPFNVMWAQRASLLVFILSDTLIQLPRAQSLSVSHSHSFDAGAAWALLALQATRLGYHTHGMTGVDFERARTELSVPDRPSTRLPAAPLRSKVAFYTSCVTNPGDVDD